MFGIHRRRGMPIYGIGLCLTPWTAHTGTLYNGTSRAAHATLPLYSPGLTIIAKAMPAATASARYHCPLARRLRRTRPLGNAYAPYPP